MGGHHLPSGSVATGMEAANRETASARIALFAMDRSVCAFLGGRGVVGPRIVHTVTVTGVVDRYVDSLPSGWHRAACTRLLEDIRASARFTEHIKWGHPYFEADGSAVLKWFCAKRWINVYFYRGRELRDPDGLFEPSRNARMLTVRVTPTVELNREAFRELVRAAATLATQ